MKEVLINNNLHRYDFKSLFPTKKQGTELIGKSKISYIQMKKKKTNINYFFYRKINL